VSLTGCVNPRPEPNPTLAEANAKFLEICREEYSITPKVVALDNTVYVYLPVEHPIVSLKASGVPKTNRQASEKERALLFSDGNFANNSFHVSFDVGPQKAYPQDPGYDYNPDERVTRTQHFLLHSLSRVYNELDQDSAPGDREYLDPNKESTHEGVVRFKPVKHAPDFVSIIITDIVNGLELVNTFHYKDYQHYSFGHLPVEEFYKRNLQKIVGNINAIGDYEGEHIDYKEITWPEFLAKQIKNRIDFKYNQSAFPPSDDDEKEILKIVNETLSAYNFNALDEVRLENLDGNFVSVFGKEDLDTLSDDGSSRTFSSQTLHVKNGTVSDTPQSQTSPSGFSETSPSRAPSEPSQSSATPESASQAGKPRIFQLEFDETGRIKNIEESK